MVMQWVSLFDGDKNFIVIIFYSPLLLFLSKNNKKLPEPV